jgi:hypothetical protein
MTKEESSGLLEYLFRHSTRPEIYIYRHRWRRQRRGHLGQSLHAASRSEDFDHNSPRHMVRHGPYWERRWVYQVEDEALTERHANRDLAVVLPRRLTCAVHLFDASVRPVTRGTAFPRH